MSENENKPGNESRSDFAEQPSPTPEPSEATSQPQHIACPKCSALVLAGAQLCRVCGSQLPSTTSPSWPSASLSQHPRRNVRRIVGIALIAVLMIGVAGYVAYQQVGKYSERLYADQSLSQVQITCFGIRVDNSTLSVSNGVYYGYATVYQIVGVSNSANLVMDAKWTFTINYTSAGELLSDSARFHIPAYGGAYPTFTFRITDANVNNQVHGASYSKFFITIYETYVVTGAYSTYNLARHLTYGSSLRTGPLASSFDLPLPDCSSLPR